ncbi:MAG: hypothetical protein ACYCO9_01815 [Streptosporangiaceae bacterium]
MAASDAAACEGSNPDGSSAPTSSEINALTAPASISKAADVVSDTRTFYDDPPVLSGGVAVPSNATWPQAAPGNADVSVVQKASNYVSGAFTYLTTSATAYDSYGRPVTAYDANGSKTTPTSDPASDIYSYAVSNSAPTLVTTKKLNDQGGYVTSTSLYDALLRLRQTQVPTPQGGILVSDKFYDSRGWLWKVNANYWDSSASPGNSIITMPDSQVPNQTVTAFDGLGRPVLVTPYDDSAVKSTTATAYYGDRVTTVPAAGATPTYSYNTRGELSDISFGGENWTTSTSSARSPPGPIPTTAPRR